MRKLILLVVVLSFIGCDIKKRAIKNKEDRTVSELTERTITRKGDTVTYLVPKITYKDTTIYTVNREGTTLRTVYNDAGNISQIDCMSSLIKVTERMERLMEENIKQKDKDKEENFDSSIILYGFIGIALIVAVIAFFGFRFLSQNTKALNTVLEGLQK
jgi:hypothetical protein